MDAYSYLVPKSMPNSFFGSCKAIAQVLPTLLESVTAVTWFWEHKGQVRSVFQSWELVPSPVLALPRLIFRHQSPRFNMCTTLHICDRHALPLC